MSVQVIQTGEPRETGHYVCWLPGVGVPTVIRFWLAGGHGWLNNLQEPIAGNVAGWLGPLPTIDEIQWNVNEITRAKAKNAEPLELNKLPPMEFDL